MSGLTKFNFTKSRKIALGVAGIVATGAIIAIATQARAQFQIAQFVPPVAPEVPAAPPAPAVPGPFTAPSQIGVPAAPPAVPPRPSIRRPRRVPIEPVPMPGDVRAPLPALPAPLDIRTIPGTQTTPISGISGKVMLTPVCPVTAPSASCQIRPYTGALRITSVARDRVIRLATDEFGQFQLRLIPGMYVVEPDSPIFPIGTRQTITVINNVIRQTEFNFQGNPVAPAPAPVGVTLPPLPGAAPAPGVAPQ
jgi:hypothetical protein